MLWKFSLSTVRATHNNLVLRLIMEEFQILKCSPMVPCGSRRQGELARPIFFTFYIRVTCESLCFPVIVC